MQTLMAVNLQEIFSYELYFNFKLTSYIDVYIKERAITREGVNMPITMSRKHRMFHVVPCFLRMSSFFALITLSFIELEGGFLRLSLSPKFCFVNENASQEAGKEKPAHQT